MSSQAILPPPPNKLPPLMPKAHSGGMWQSGYQTLRSRETLFGVDCCFFAENKQLSCVGRSPGAGNFRAACPTRTSYGKILPPITNRFPWAGAGLIPLKPSAIHDSTTSPGARIRSKLAYTFIVIWPTKSQECCAVA